MRYLGWGVGHNYDSEFPHEADELTDLEEDLEGNNYPSSSTTTSNPAGLEADRMLDGECGDGLGYTSDEYCSSDDDNAVHYEY